MRAFVQAVRERVETTGYPFHFATVDGTPAGIYVLGVTGSGDPADEVDVTGLSDAVDDTFTIKTVASSGDAALGANGRVRAALAGGLTVPGWLVWFTLTGSLDVQVDRDAVSTSTGTFPVFTTDFYRLHAVPA